MTKITLNDFFRNRTKKSKRWQQMLAIGVGLMVGQLSTSQTIGDYASGFSQSLETYTPITGETVLWSGYDGFDTNSTTVNLTTPFNYLGTDYSVIYVNSDGYIIFGDTTTSGYPITVGRNGVAAFAADLDAKAASAGTALPSIGWKEEGNEIIFQWENLARWTGSGASSAENLKFQIRLNTSNSEIKIVYGNCTDRATPTTSAYPQVGLGNTTSSYSNRTIAAGSGDWINSSAGTAPANTMAFNGATKPSEGLTFKWTLPDCTSPSGLTATSIDVDNANLEWNGAGSNFDIKWGTIGFDVQTAGTLIENVSSGYNLSGLTSNTDYSYYVRIECSVGNYSNWSGPFNFSTACTSISTFPWSENFDGVTTPDLPNCWSQIDANNDGDFWKTWTGGYGVNSSTAVGLYTDYNAGNNNDYLVLPRFDLSGNQRLKFSVRARTTGEPNDYRVVLSTTSSDPDNFTTELKPLTTVNWTTHQEVDWIDLSSYSGEVYIAIHVPSGGLDGYYIYFDNFFIENIPTCLQVTDLSVTNETHNSADLNWVSTGTDFDIIWGESGFDHLSSGTLVEGFTNGGTLSGLTPLTNYEFYVRQDCGAVNGYSLWTGPFSFKTECLPPSLIDTTEGEVCGTGEVTLSATAEAGATVLWYSAQTGGVKLGEGETFTTPEISETTSYWAAASTGNLVTVGPVSPTAQGGTIGSQTTAWNVNFTVTETTTLTSIDIFPNQLNQSGSIQLRQGTGSVVIATVPFTTTVSGGATAQTIELNFELEPGNYNLYPSLPTGGINRNISGATYPYTSSVASILGNGYDQTYFMGFYNWIFGAGCTSPRTEVVATVTTAPNFAISESTIEICNGETSSLVTITEGATDYDTYVWTPSTGVTGDATTGWSFNPTETTTYTLSASQSTGAECSTNATVTVNVNALPQPITITGSEEICENTISELTSGHNISGTAIFGNSTATTPSATSWPNPFSAWYGGTKHQMLFKVDEITAQGLVAGSEITAVSFDIFAFASSACTNFTIRMGHTSVDVMTGMVSGTTTVYGPQTFTPSATGIVTFTFNTPFIWDGSSNIIVETVHNAGNGGNGSGTRTKASTTSFNSVFRGASDNIAGGIAGFDALTSYGTNGAHNIRPDMTFSHSLVENSIVWSPATDLYTDAAATIPYEADTYSATVYYKPSNTGSVTYTATSFNDADCFVSNSIEITVNASSVTPTGDVNQEVVEGTTLADLAVVGDNLVWYSDEELTNEIPSTNEVVDGTTYYVVSTTESCGNSSALAITVTIDSCADTPLPTADSPQEMTIGQTVGDIAVTGENLTWYSDEELTTVVEETFVLEEGSHTFYVTQTIGDCTSEAIEIVVEVTLSAGGFDMASFRAYPNPVKDIFTISYNKNISDVTVVNMLGQIVVKQSVQSTDAQINMSALPAGNYVVKVAVDGAVQTLKVVKQ